MKKLLIAIYDIKAEQFFSPITVVTLGVAYRDILHELEHNAESILSRNPADYEIWQLGTFDNEDGKILETTPIKILTVASLVKE